MELGDQSISATCLFSVARPEEVVQKRGDGRMVVQRKILVDWEETWSKVRRFLMNIPMLLFSAAEFALCCPPAICIVLQKESDILCKKFRDSVLLQNLLVNMFWVFFSK